MNWGWKITILMSSFVLFMSYLVYRTFTTKVDLVSEDYYAKELEFQDQIDSENAVSSLELPLIVLRENQDVVIKFPNGQPESGNINFFRPSDASKDFNIEVDADSMGVQKVNVNSVEKGMYRIRVSWSKGGVNYYKSVKMNI